MKSTTIILLTIIALCLLNTLIGCTSSKVVYVQNHEGKWKPASKQSETTGWVRAEK